jgi:alpha-amylase
MYGGRLNWGPEAICHNNGDFGGQGAGKTGEDYVAAPNVDHTNDTVMRDLTLWLRHLRDDVGFDGWRFDFVKVRV